MGQGFRGADHLPKKRGQADRPMPPPELPEQRRGSAPQMRGRYPDYDVLGQADHWDHLTRHVVEGRLEATAEIRCLEAREAETLGAFCDVVLAQDSEPRVPVLAMLDERLAEGRLDGYRYADMPEDHDLWRLVAQGLDEAARRDGCESFALASDEQRRDICQAFANGGLEGGVWRQLPQERAWKLTANAIVAAFYSHPWAWNEIGFGGPAYPRGYARLDAGQRESWEGEEAFQVDPVADVVDRGIE